MPIATAKCVCVLDGEYERQRCREALTHSITLYTFLNTNQICRLITSLGGKQYAKNETRHTGETEGSFSDQTRLAEKIYFRNS